ncbi:RNA polymerase sigma factor SigJ [Humibacter ginsenosidimutans]|uniref:Sigma-70 family RNA polymerase sigma factor n=1 Tax=Humibacter ginsenosidimutans TaxID=2599293 RepID=A0A5B8M7U2_9MICO|nr:RNA polymerase sigma factor SigJ [Humibacter ginsenosidimutans]QDZ16269.1 sigma-70 family RNA polymerase sigma factor [Humibacter ginsenosidimutans]
MDLATEAEGLRPLMFSIAYRMLGSVTDAEDVVQSGMLRLHERARAGEVIERPDAFASTITTRLSIDALRAARRTRELYVGPWLPEPLLVDDVDPARQIERDETASVAVLRMLERLGPVERAVFVLHESLGLDYDEIAEIVERTPAACRQILHRARQRVGADGTRFEVDRARSARLADDFLRALRTGDVDGVVRLLSNDVVLTADGGGKAPAIQHPMEGAVAVARFLIGLMRRGEKLGVKVESVFVNGEHTFVFRSAREATLSVLTLHISGDEIRSLSNQLNPDKLHHLGPTGDLFALVRGEGDTEHPL